MYEKDKKQQRTAKNQAENFIIEKKTKTSPLRRLDATSNQKENN